MRRNLVLLCAAIALLAGCTPGSESRRDAANRVALRANLKPVTFHSAPYAIQGWQAGSQPEAVLRVYIEGDGFAWRSATQPSADPTPTFPNALELAAADGSPHVLYLARPCQYIAGSYCRPGLWTSARFSRGVLDSYMQVLDAVKAQRHVQHFELVGFSGGGVIAALLAAKRSDVANLRTVSTPIDIALWARLKHFSPLTGSLNPADEDDALSEIPQIHFWGEKDAVVPYAVLEGFQNHLPDDGRCSKLHTVAGATHSEGWADKWRQLIVLIPECRSFTAMWHLRNIAQKNAWFSTYTYK